MVQVDNNYIFL